MPAPAWENLDAFLQADDFAVEAVISPQEGSSFTVTGIFDDPYLNAELGEYDFDTAKPRFTCKEADVLNVIRGYTLTVGGKTYDVLSTPNSDGAGMAVIELAVQP